MKKHFADIWEIVADTVPEEIALVHGAVRRTWREYDDRAARLAAVFASAGFGCNSKVALYAYNSNEYLESQFALFKCRAVAVNVNYRYLEQELHYILENSDAGAVVFQAGFAPQITAIRPQLPKLRLFIEIEDGSGEHLDGALAYEEAIAGATPMPRIERSEDDIYMLYTGGTTGYPKGVMYRMGDFCAGRFRTFDLRGLPRPRSVSDLAMLLRGLKAEGRLPRSLPACPLMHGTGLWLGSFQPLFLGARVVTMDNRHFDPHGLWKTVEREKITEITFVGDAFARPMLAALEQARAGGRAYDVSSVNFMVSSGVMCSLEVKRGLLEFCDATILDAMGSTEGAMGLSIMGRDTPAYSTATFQMNETTKVFTEDGREVVPGTGEAGMIACSGVVPLCYFKDPEKSERTFRTVNGRRYTFGGDYARINADGTLELLGRGNNCINTGGEKVFPEEVEEVMKSLADVADCLVVGVADARFGQRIVAVTSLRGNAKADAIALIAQARTRLASYKLPRDVIIVPEVRRGPNGKADYQWARTVAQPVLFSNVPANTA
ncbi:MAG TPA: acyl-CoA synthetase [Rhizomicrobium sp.]|jgi:fatty-acyl-CoA synthase